MDGKIFPDGYFAGSPGLNDLFETAAAVQFNHRLGAYLLVAGVVWFFLAVRLTPAMERTGAVSRAGWLLAAVFAQMLLGIWTVLAATPIALGLAHQGGALIVLAAALYAVHGLSGDGAPAQALKAGAR